MSELFVLVINQIPTLESVPSPEFNIKLNKVLQHLDLRPVGLIRNTLIEKWC